jgi:hypothetical protein
LNQIANEQNFSETKRFLIRKEASLVTRTVLGAFNQASGRLEPKSKILFLGKPLKGVQVSV